MSDEDASKLVDAAPARAVRNAVKMTLHWYLPETQKSRFHLLGKDFEMLDSHGWEKAFHMAKVKLNRALEELYKWQDRPHADELFGAWDDEVFFFYVLHFQFLWIRLHSLDDNQMIPWGDDFWDWGIVVQDDIPWMVYTFPTVVPYMEMNPRPYVWGFYSPSDVKISTLEEQGIDLNI